MIDLHYWPTPNGWKISIMLEECGLPYRLVPVNIGRGEQFAPEFLAISPNNRMPAIVDHTPAHGGPAPSVFESGAILVYLAEKSGRFLGTELRQRMATLQWLMWQVGGLGPMAGQNGHFLLYAPERLPYAIERYGNEVNRLYGVLDAQLGRTGAHVSGTDYSIADMAIFPWVRTHKAQQVALQEFPNVQRWYNALLERPAVQRGLTLGKELRAPKMDDAARRSFSGRRRRPFATPPPNRIEFETTMIEFFFDCSSPWTYLAFHNVQPLAAELGVPLRWCPILVGGVFNSVNPSVYAMRDNPVPAKQAYQLKDIQDWARHCGLRIKFPPTVFPINSVKAMRGCVLLAPQGKLVPFARSVFEVYWGRDEDISQDAVLAQCCQRADVDAPGFFTGIAQGNVKEQLKANTDELIRRGGFGSPSIFVNGDDMYFGNDRLVLVREAILRAQEA